MAQAGEQARARREQGRRRRRDEHRDAARRTEEPRNAEGGTGDADGIGDASASVGAGGERENGEAGDAKTEEGRTSEKRSSRLPIVATVVAAAGALGAIGLVVRRVVSSRRGGRGGDESGAEERSDGDDEGGSRNAADGDSEAEPRDDDDLATVLKRTGRDVALAATNLLPSSEKQATGTSLDGEQEPR